MGITIHHKLGQKKEWVKETLDRAEEVAVLIMNHQAKPLGVKMKVARIGENALFIDIGNCETLVFNFETVDFWKKEEAKNGWNYQWACLKDIPSDMLEGKLWSAEFCKTQFAEKLVEHRWVAEILRTVASHCQYAEVSDEGDYYHTGNIEDAADSIAENGVMINSLVGKLEGVGFKKANITKGGETIIKSKRK